MEKNDDADLFRETALRLQLQDSVISDISIAWRILSFAELQLAQVPIILRVALRLFPMFLTEWSISRSHKALKRRIMMRRELNENWRAHH